MKSLILLLSLAMTSFSLAKDVDLGTTNNPYTQEERVFVIDSSKLENLPTWDGASDLFPLSLNDAIKSASEKARSDYPDKLKGIRSIFLVPRHLPTGQSLWAYSISFRLSDTEARRVVSYLVLLDNTVVSAVPIKKAQQAAANP